MKKDVYCRENIMPLPLMWKGFQKDIIPRTPIIFLRHGSLPSMPDDKGHLILYNRELDQIDELVYSEEMHFSLLSTYEGVALEKINPAGKSEEKANWHSASESSGWGTPGAPNSIFDEVPATSDNVDTFPPQKYHPIMMGMRIFLRLQ